MTQPATEADPPVTRYSKPATETDPPAYPERWFLRCGNRQEEDAKSILEDFFTANGEPSDYFVHVVLPDEWSDNLLILIDLYLKEYPNPLDVDIRYRVWDVDQEDDKFEFTEGNYQDVENARWRCGEIEWGPDDSDEQLEQATQNMSITSMPPN